MAEIIEAVVVEAAFQIGAGIDAGRGVALEINQVAGLVAVARLKEMVEAYLQQRRQRRVGGDVAADAGIFLILVVDHGHGVPAQQGLNAAL